MPNPNLINQQCETYFKACKLDGPEVSEVQRRETRRAFFAGARALWHVMNNASSDTDDPDEVTDWDIQLMRWLNEEIEQFGKAIEAGKE